MVVTMTEDEEKMIQEMLDQDPDHRKGEPIEVFKLLKMGSLRDWSKKRMMPKMEKTVSDYKKEMFPEESIGSKKRKLKLFSEASV